MRQCVSLPKACTVWQAIKWGEKALIEAGRPDAPIDAKLLLMHVLKYDQTQLLLNRERLLKEEDYKSYVSFIKRRSQGIPLQYLTGEQEFMGFNFHVNPHVLIPRQDTETLIEAIINKQKECPIKTAIDIGTGTGCIGITLALLIPKLAVTLIDISQEALQVAADNVKMHELTDRVKCMESNILSAYTGQKVDLIVSNPPYIPLKDIDDLMIEVKDYEPHLALTDGGNGLYFYEEITKQSRTLLKDKGLLAYEIGYDQGEAVKSMMEEQGYQEVTLYQDLAGKDRVVIGQYRESCL